MSDERRATNPQAPAAAEEDRAAAGEPAGGLGGFLAPAEVSAWRALLIPVLAFVTALAIGALVIVFSDTEVLDAWSRFFSDPVEALRRSGVAVKDTYQALFAGSLGSPIKFFDAFTDPEVSVASAFRPLSETITFATPLIFAGLSVALGFRAGLFNIGAEGQLNMGATLAAYVGFTFTGLPAVLHVPFALLAGFVAGGIWGAVPGVLKARTGAHEVITTIMMNFIALFLLDYLLLSSAFQREGRSDAISKVIAESAELPALPGGLRANVGFLLALLAALGVGYLLFRTTKGFEFRAVGANPDAARYAGISVPRTYVLVMTLAGGLSGIGGAALLLGVNKTLTGGAAGGVGFDAIALALLGRAHPVGVVAAAFLFGMLRAGGTAMQAATGIPVDIVVVIQALIILFIAAPALVHAIYRIRVRRELGAEVFTKGWGG